MNRAPLFRRVGFETATDQGQLATMMLLIAPPGPLGPRRFGPRKPAIHGYPLPQAERCGSEIVGIVGLRRPVDPDGHPNLIAGLGNGESRLQIIVSGRPARPVARNFDVDPNKENVRPHRSAPHGKKPSAHPESNRRSNGRLTQSIGRSKPCRGSALFHWRRLNTAPPEAALTLAGVKSPERRPLRTSRRCKEDALFHPLYLV